MSGRMIAATSVPVDEPVYGVPPGRTADQMHQLVRVAATLDDAYEFAKGYTRAELQALADLMYLDVDDLPARHRSAAWLIAKEARQ